jgi:hypothetical protein
LLRWLRQQVETRGHNTASLADQLGRPRAELRKLLTGVEPMTVDDLLAITKALELAPEDLGIAGTADLPDVEESTAPEPVQFRNQPEALFRLGFDLGIDLLFLADVTQLVEWGGPDTVLAQYRDRDRELPIQLDAAWHRHMQPDFGEHALAITLSFDKLYRCTFPWSAIRRIVFTPFTPPPPEPKKPKLRLVK